MLKLDPRMLESSQQINLPPDITISQMLAFVGRARWVIASALALCLACGLAYFWLATPVYSARAELEIDPRKSQLLPMAGSAEAVLADNFYIQTQVALLKSETVLISAIRAEKLAEDPTFLRRSSPSLVSRLLSLTSTSEKETSSEEALKLRLAVKTLQGNLDVRQNGLTNIIEISYRSYDPELPARIANGVAQAYINDKLEERADATRNAGEWLQKRISELREQSVAAARAVADFKTTNKIVETPRGRMNEQQLGDLNSQIVTARAHTAEMQAKLARIEQVLSEAKPDAVVSEALSSNIITRLRNQYLDLGQREGEVSSRLGRDNPAAVEVRKQMGDLGRMILTELRRIAEGFRSDYEIARARETALDTGLALAVQNTAAANQADVTMRELESSAQALKTIYDAFLQRYTNIVQVQSFPIPEGRLVTEATRPLARSWPRGSVVMPIAAAAGIILGLGLALLRENLRNAIRTDGELQRISGQEVLGRLPRPRRSDRGRKSLFQADDHPYSPYAESVRVMATSLHHNMANAKDNVVGVVSSLPDEGTTKLAVSLAQIFAAGGNRVLLLDCNFRIPVLTEALGFAGADGLAQIAAGLSNGDGLVRRVRDFDFLPAGKVEAAWHVGDLLDSARLASFVNGARSSFSYVIADLPPMLPAVDARVSAGFIRRFIFVVKQGVTDRDSIQKSVAALREVNGSIIGGVFTNADSVPVSAAPARWKPPGKPGAARATRTRSEPMVPDTRTFAGK